MKVRGSNPGAESSFLNEEGAVESLGVYPGYSPASRWTSGLRLMNEQEWQLLGGHEFDPTVNPKNGRKKVAANAFGRLSLGSNCFRAGSLERGRSSARLTECPVRDGPKGIPTPGRRSDNVS